MKTFEGFRGGTTQICLENEGIGGIAKVIKGDHFSEVNIQRGDPPNFTLFSPKSTAPQAINNDRSLISYIQTLIQ